MTRFLILFAFAFALFLQPVSSQSFNTRKLDTLFQLLSEKNKAMGSVALMKEGKIIYTKAIFQMPGRNRLHQLPNTGLVPFRRCLQPP
jgi:hypothetical protein